MKTKNTLAALTAALAIVAAMFSVTAFADEEAAAEPAAKIGETEYATLAEAVSAASTGNTITLLSDAELTATLSIANKQIILDLGGNTLGAASGFDTAVKVQRGTLTVKNGSINVPNTAFEIAANKNNELSTMTSTVTLESDVTVTSETDCCVYLYGKTAKLVVDGAKLTSNGVYATIQGQGTTKYYGNTVIEIKNGAEIISSKSSAMYIPQKGTVSVSDSTVQGATTAIEVRAGDLTISGDSVITGGMGELTATPNGSGATTTNAALAVVQHTTKLDTNINITGGTFIGTASLYEADIQENNTDNVSIAISGGNFQGSVSVEDVDKFISGGEFSAEPDASYLAEGLTAEYIDGAYVIKDTGITVSTKNTYSADGANETAATGFITTISGGALKINTIKWTVTYAEESRYTEFTPENAISIDGAGDAKIGLIVNGFNTSDAIAVATINGIYAEKPDIQ